MSHQSQIVAVEKLAPGLISVHLRCCGDKTTDMKLTLGTVSPDTGEARSAEEIDADIAKHHATVQARHEADQAAEQHMKRLGTQATAGDCGCAK